MCSVKRSCQILSINLCLSFYERDEPGCLSSTDVKMKPNSSVTEEMIIPLNLVPLTFLISPIVDRETNVRGLNIPLRSPSV